MGSLWPYEITLALLGALVGVAPRLACLLPSESDWLSFGVCDWDNARLKPLDKRQTRSWNIFSANSISYMIRYSKLLQIK